MSIPKNRRRNKHRRDAWQNPTTGFGGANDPMTRAMFRGIVSNASRRNIGGVPFSRQELEDMYRHDWLTRRIIQTFPDDSLREGIDFTIEDTEVTTSITDKLDELFVFQELKKALSWARLYGASIILLGALDGRDPTEPLDEDNIKSFRFMNVFDRWQLQIDSYFDNPLEQNFGQPEIYRLQPINTAGGETRENKRIHASRVIRIDGDMLPDFSLISNSGWNDSIMVGINDALKNYGVTIQSGAVLMQDFITKVLKIPNITDILSREDGQTILDTRIQYAMNNMSSLGMTVIGDDEEFTKIQHPIAGLVEMMNTFVELISAASLIPRARLFGQQLGVLAGATETTKAYFDTISAYQTDKVQRPLDRIITLILKDKENPVTRGVEPEVWSWRFLPLFQDTQKEKAETRKIMAEGDAIYIDKGVLTATEVADSRFGTAEYSVDTTLDTSVERASEVTPLPGTAVGETIIGAEPEPEPNDPNAREDQGEHRHLDSKGNPTGPSIASPTGGHRHRLESGELTSLEVEVADQAEHVHREADTGELTGPAVVVTDAKKPYEKSKK